MSECQSYQNIKNDQLIEDKMPAFRQEKQEQLFSERELQWTNVWYNTCLIKRHKAAQAWKNVLEQNSNYNNLRGQPPGFA